MQYKKHFAADVFDGNKMKKYLARSTVKAIVLSRKTGKKISPKHAENFAKGVLKWAVFRGMDRYVHLFQPLNNITAGKRDCLYCVNSQNLALPKFRQKELQNGEGDASGFPSGGLRQTFEARGITEWDVAANPFIMDGCLFLPTTFKSHSGEALDKKIPLKNSMSALDKQAKRLLKILGFNCKSVFSVVGGEQEYFLVEKSVFHSRPDLVGCGRTLFGKPQKKASSYFHAPTKQTVEFWQEVDERLWRLGIVVKTEHREVAPCQYELAPCYAPANLACEQNLLIQNILCNVAEKHGLVCLLKEKPFDGMNGSGKHNNWSLLTDDDTNLFERGKTPKENARFLLFLSAVVWAVNTYGDLLKASAMSASNDNRLGGFEAPTAIVSLFLGDVRKAVTSALSDENWLPGQHLLPPFAETTDRNRTAPLAFCKNKFEFRMVGSSANLADSSTVLNTIVADGLKVFADSLEKSTDVFRDAKQLAELVFTKHSGVLFDGNSYSAEWKTEAARRGINSLCKTPEAIACLLEPKCTDLFERHGILTKREIFAIHNVQCQAYADTVFSEATVLEKLVTTQAIPFAEKTVREKVTATHLAREQGVPLVAEERNLKNLLKLLRSASRLAEKLRKSLLKIGGQEMERAQLAQDILLPLLQQGREILNKMEGLCPKNLWFPTYEDLLR